MTRVLAARTVAVATLFATVLSTAAASFALATTPMPTGRLRLAGPAPMPAAPSPADSGTASPGPSPSAGASASPAPTSTFLLDQPRDGCLTFEDPQGDAAPQIYQGHAATGSDQDLDVTGANFKTTATTIRAYAHIAKLAAAPAAPYANHRFDLAFTIGDADLVFSSLGTALANGVDAPSVAPKVSTDTKHSMVVLTIDKTKLAKAMGRPLNDGLGLTGLHIDTFADTAAGGKVDGSVPTAIPAPPGTVPSGWFPADTAAPDGDLGYVLGDNTCFLPPTPVLKIGAPATVQYGDNLNVTGTLTSPDGSGVPNEAISATYEDQVQAATTDANGVAGFVFPITDPPGPQSLQLAFAGDQAFSPVTTTASVQVVLEKTMLTATAAKGLVQATLRDDDKHPVGDQEVTFTIGKVTRTVVTDEDGLASLAGVKNGSAVTVAYAGSEDEYAGAKPVSVKA
jgi:hypothetical protein